MQTAKEKITTAVREYQRLFPDEYQNFLKSNAVTINKLNDKWGSTGKGDHAIERHLFDTPEKLYYAINQILSAEELDWFFNRGAFIKNTEGIKWFIETFPQFKVTKQF